MSYNFLKPNDRFGRNVKNELDLSNFATKASLKEQQELVCLI